MKTIIYVSMLLLVGLSMAGQEKLKGNFVYDGKTYALLTNQDVTSKNYTIKISRASATATPDEEESKIALVYDVYNEAIFINTVESIMKSTKLAGVTFVGDRKSVV